MKRKGKRMRAFPVPPSGKGLSCNQKLNCLVGSRTKIVSENLLPHIAVTAACTLGITICLCSSFRPGVGNAPVFVPALGRIFTCFNGYVLNNYLNAYIMLSVLPLGRVSENLNLKCLLSSPLRKSFRSLL